MALLLAAGGHQLGQVVAWIVDMASIHVRMGKGRGTDGWDDKRRDAVLCFGLRREGSGVGDDRRC